MQEVARHAKISKRFWMHQASVSEDVFFPSLVAMRLFDIQDHEPNRRHGHRDKENHKGWNGDLGDQLERRKQKPHKQHKKL